MVTRAGLVKLGDFGFVKSRLDKELGYEGMVLGTPDYIAPEQAMGKEDVDYRADVYSLGATFYHMLTGRPMYNGTPSKVMLAHTREPMPEPRQYRPSLPDDVLDVLKRMLAKDPNQRYSNLNALFMDLEALRETHMPKAPPKYEIGKSSVMRALNIEKSRHAEMAERLKQLESRSDQLMARAAIAGGAALAAAALAVLFLILWLVS
jgi:serine/threonine protein kinase